MQAWRHLISSVLFYETTERQYPNSCYSFEFVFGHKFMYFNAYRPIVEWISTVRNNVEWNSRALSAVPGEVSN
jgi:hypothetical protein